MRHLPRLPGIALALAALVAGVPAARAAGGLFLTWNDCVLAATASHDASWSCDSNLGEHRLTCAFSPPAVVDSVLGFELVVDIQHAAAELPDWWRFAANGCRYGQLGANLDFAGRPGCADFSRGLATGGVMGYYVTEPRGGAGQARIKVAGAWLPDSGYATLSPLDTYYAAEVIVRHGFTTGGTACAGCALPACLVLNGMWIRRQPGAAGGDVELSVPGPDQANWATWQGGAGADCAAVPVRAVTWGRLKGLYR
jgi:hypothetical protein